jgi:hypothetical protein
MALGKRLFLIENVALFERFFTILGDFLRFWADFERFLTPFFEGGFCKWLFVMELCKWGHGKEREKEMKGLK